MMQNNVKIIKHSSNEMKEILQYIKDKYGKGYLKKFRYTSQSK